MTIEERLSLNEQRGARDAQRLTAIEEDLREMRGSLKSLENIAARGSGVLNTVLLIGGALGWVVGLAMSLYALVIKH